MNKAYNPKDHEPQIAQKWEDAKASLAKMKSESKTGESFAVPIPPPNVTGQLHLGHAMMLVIQDIMTRYHRMKGDSTLWLPGTDHAAIATESVVLKNLGVASREEFTREEFMEKCFDHTKKTHSTITNQVKKMGASCDFTRERYTMDIGLSNAVWKIFTDLYKQGLIVRGYRMVNWSSGAQSVLADDELEYEDKKDTFAYIKCGRFVMGTVRSETKCADSPLVLHPDENYVIAKYADEEFVFAEVLFDDIERRNKIFNSLPEGGKWEKISVHPGSYFEGEEFETETYAGMRKFFVLCDEEVIDINKGTGAMTISVNHAADDYLLAKKYPEILKDYYFEKIGFDGKMTKLAGELEGETVEVARKMAVKLMIKKNLIVGLERDYVHNVPLCYRTGCVVEPMISPQWFVDVNKEFDWVEGVGAVKNKNTGDHKGTPLHTENSFIFVRHGESEDNLKQVLQSTISPLSEKGIDQAKKTAEELKNTNNIKKIISSPAKRALQTAEIIGEALNLEIEIDNNISCYQTNTCAGISKKDVLPLTPLEYCENNGGESRNDFFNRIDSAVESIKSHEKINGEILIVSHRSTLSAMQTKLEGGSVEDAITKRRTLENADHGYFGDITIPVVKQIELNQSKLFYARHGESEGNMKKVFQGVLDFDLTEKGKQDAVNLAQNIKDKNITLIVSSPLKRANNTAQIVKQTINLNSDVIVIPELHELNWGAEAGKPWDITGEMKSIEYYLENNKTESISGIYSRIKTAKQKIQELQKTTDGNVLIVGHGQLSSFVFAENNDISETDFVDFYLSTYKHFGNGEVRELISGDQLRSDPFREKGTPLQGSTKTSLKKLTYDAVLGENPGVELIPNRFDKIYHQWIDNLQDWCISRQIWWGHQIPIWYDQDGNEHVAHEQTLLFARHGQSEDNVNEIIGGDSGLTEKGKAQAEELANKLISEKRNITKIYCSSLKRSRQTAEIIKNIIENTVEINSNLSLDIEEFPDFHEVFTGDLENKPRKIQGKTSLYTMQEMQTGETMDEIETRAKGFWNNISEKGPEEGDILLVGHRTFLSQIFGVKDGCTASNLIDYRDRMDMNTCEVKEVTWMMKPKIQKKETENQQNSKIFMARHGQSEGNIAGVVCGSGAPDFALTEQGMQDAQKLAEECMSKGITKIITSTMKRTQQTAAVVAKKLGLEIEIWEDIEEMNMGEFDGMIFEDIPGTLPERVHTMYENTQGENSQALLQRAQKFIKKVQTVKTDGNILVVNHLVFSLATLTVLEDGTNTQKLYDRRINKGGIQNGELRELPIQNYLRQDPDTLDTWFSSALWPFSTLGWPDKTPDLENFFPTNVLETGHDILFFWVARMIMFSKFATGKDPFKEVYLHGLVADEHGKKMSKSKGNGIDPLDMIEKFGTDAVRMSLVVGTTPGNQVNLGEKKIEGYRNFANKLWNVSRYIVQLETNNEQLIIENKTLTLPEQWILSKLQTLIGEVRGGIENHKYGEVGQKLYDFTWNDLADWMLESAKAVESKTIGSTLSHVLRELLQLMHPYMPFITETIWEEMKIDEERNILALTDFPEQNSELINNDAEEYFEKLQNIIGKIRSLRSASKVDPVKKITAILKTDDHKFFKENEAIIKLLARIETLEFGEKPEEECVGDIIDGTEIFLPLAGMLDAAKEKERKQKELDEAKKMLKNLEGRMANKKYMDNAPDHLVQQTKEQYAELQEKIRVLEG